jgi:hypothetical protein
MLNEQKITYRMKNLIESGFFGSKTLLTEAFADGDKVRLFQAAYNYTYDKNLAVDGVKGGQTDAAIADVKKQLGKDKLDDAGAKDFYQKFLVKLDDNKGSINVGQGGANTNKILNQAIQALINLAGTPLGIDGVIGTKTIAAIKTVAEDSEVINSQNITAITGKAVKNILQLGVEGIATTQGGGKDAAAEEGGTKSKYGTCLSGDCENGQGKLKNTKNNIYIGTFVDFYHTGNKNEIQFANGDIFKGQTLQGHPVKGTYTYKSGSVFTGDFHPNSDNEKYGTFKSKDGWTYTGGFNVQGKMEGTNSLYTNKNGKQFKLNFTAGKPVGYTWEQIDSKEDNGTVTISKEAKDSAFKADMAKFKSIIDAKIKDGSLTGKNNIFSGFYSKVGATLQILDANNNLLSKTTVIPNELKENQGRWSYYTGGAGSKVMNFGTNNSVTKYVYTYPKDASNSNTSNSNKAATANTSPTTSSKETLSKFNIDMKKLLGIIKDYQNKWGFFYKEGTTIKFYDSLDDKKIFTSSVTPEILKLQGGWWVYKDNKIEFKSKNTGKVDYNFIIS